MPAFGRADDIGVASESLGASFKDLSVLIEGEVCRFESLEREFSSTVRSRLTDDGVCIQTCRIRPWLPSLGHFIPRDTSSVRSGG